MAVIDMGREPSRRELNLFGVMLLVVAGVIGVVVYWRFEAPSAARAIWITGAVVASIHLAFPILRRPIYFGWMYATYPIGWVISHAVLAAIYYLLITPTGLLLRTTGWNPLQRGFDRETESYWIRDNPHRTLEGYFRQY
jgi:ABC-type uncharacterized transport system permease subunit